MELIFDLYKQKDLFYLLLQGWIGIAIVSALYLMFSPAPYGRFSQNATKLLDQRLCWLLMELPSFLWPLYLAYYYVKSLPNLTYLNPVIAILFLIWEVHYFQRVFIYPLFIAQPKPESIFLLFASSSFVSINAIFNFGQVLFVEDPNDEYPLGEFPRWNHLLGLGIWAIGFLINVTSDQHLVSLRKRGLAYQQNSEKTTSVKQYYIPTFALFQLVSCANYTGEIAEWLGFWLVAQNMSGFSFFLWTCCNLIPRALSYHKFYLDTFKDKYPQNRKAVIPFLL